MGSKSKDDAMLDTLVMNTDLTDASVEPIARLISRCSVLGLSYTISVADEGVTVCVKNEDQGYSATLNGKSLSEVCEKLYHIAGLLC